jgi:hypothetical protein
MLALFAVGVSGPALAQGPVGYGVTANGTLFRFDPFAPAGAVSIGSLGIVPEAIDFRPTTDGDPNRPLYAIDVGETTTQLYTVNTTTAAVTPVGAGFPTAVAGSYDLSGNQRIGFDFNPTTLQGDGSVRIRLITTNGDNLRLNSDTGAVAVVDTDLLYPPSSSPFADAAAYINSNKAVAAAGGTTILFDMDSRSDVLSIQNPPNNGTLNVVGPFGVGVNANAGIAFDIFTQAGDVDSTIGGDLGFAAFTRNDTSGGAYLLYDVDLATGATTNGRLVGGGLDFTGGMSFTYTPEPATITMGLIAIVLAMTARRRH